ncbi:hypothetical protein [Salinigranum marinum]|uniref:hypothetical protein n=1 Tax=Salinigranum marinum TaxID=1515595 RepID=UPI002989A547|nr:hypothetical protein [Salinigranum marinum]
MSALIDALLSATDPVTALLVLGLARYIKHIRADLKEDLKLIRGRVTRTESALLTDGGELRDDDS